MNDYRWQNCIFDFTRPPPAFLGSSRFPSVPNANDPVIIADADNDDGVATEAKPEFKFVDFPPIRGPGDGYSGRTRAESRTTTVTLSTIYARFKEAVAAFPKDLDKVLSSISCRTGLSVRRAFYCIGLLVMVVIRISRHQNR
jgi:hypothetical protein